MSLVRLGIAFSISLLTTAGCRDGQTDSSGVGHGSPLRAGAAFPTRTVAFAIVDIGQGTNLTSSAALERVMGLRNYILEASYGRQDLAAQVFGPFSYPMSACPNTAPQMLTSTLRPMIPGSFDHYIWYWGSVMPLCMWSGNVLAVVGTPESPARDIWLDGSSECGDLAKGLFYNFGTRDSSLMTCGAVPFADDPGSCTRSFRGDPYDPMGTGGCRHPNERHKAYQGWIEGCNRVEARSPATFTLLPFELPCDGVQALRIPMPKRRAFDIGGSQGTGNRTLTHYALELRTSRGVDDGLGPTVLVRVTPEAIPSSAESHWILDMNPSTPAIDGMAAGQSFTDPAGGVTFRVDSIAADGAKVSVEILNPGGANLCGDGSTFTAPGPGIESCNARPAGSGGAGGATGAAGAGAAAGTGGAATGGTPGTAGTTATGGTPGTAGTTATGGTPGTAGTTATGGTPGTAGTIVAGAGSTGTGGRSGSGGSAGTGGSAPGSSGGGTQALAKRDSGCECAMDSSRRDEWGGALTALASLLFARVRLRRRARGEAP